VGIAIAVYMFGKISMAHFNPAVTIGFLITKHITRIQLLLLMCRNNWCFIRKSICKIRNWI
jgi:glycerol uptake facilitator-like aquaporin